LRFRWWTWRIPELGRAALPAALVEVVAGPAAFDPLGGERSHPTTSLAHQQLHELAALQADTQAVVRLVCAADTQAVVRLVCAASSQAVVRLVYAADTQAVVRLVCAWRNGVFLRLLGGTDLQQPRGRLARHGRDGVREAHQVALLHAVAQRLAAHSRLTATHSETIRSERKPEHCLTL
jgi:hypothetical protein